MLAPCEKILRRFLPSLKAGIARELYTEHGMKQVEIAKLLGVTQAAVSKYLSGSFDAGKAAKAERAQVGAAAKRIAGGMASQKFSDGQLSLMVCEACLDINKLYDCTFHDAVVKAK